MPRLGIVVLVLAMGALIGACGGPSTSQPAGSTQAAASSSSAAVAGSQPASGVCRAFLINGPIDLGRQVIAAESSGADTVELSSDMLIAFEDVASDLPSSGQDVEDFQALAATVSAGEPWEGAMTQFIETYAEACGVHIIRH